MVIPVTLTGKYIPEWNGNKDASDPIVVKHKLPTMELVEELIPKPVIKMHTGSEGVEGGEMEMVIDPRKFVKKMVNSISGLTIEITKDDGSVTTKVITSAEDLYSPGVPAILSGLSEELGSYFQKILSQRVVDSKN